MEKSGTINVDDLQARTTLEEAAAKCGVHLDVRNRGKESRIDCPFGCAGDHVGRRDISVNVENPQRIWACHFYSCGFRGNLLTLMHGWLTGSKPSGGKLKGNEFARVKRVLASQPSADLSQNPAGKPPERVPAPPAETVRNVPLIHSADPKIRELHNLDEKFIVDVPAMSPAAASYVRRHPCLTPDAMRKWRVGYLPHDGGGDKRGTSLRGNIIYPLLSERGEVLAWIGRDVNFETKEREFLRLSPVERSDKETPAKHKIPRGLFRGNELFGQQAARLEEPGYREFIIQHGILVLEGFNGVINCDNNLGIPAVGIMSNRITQPQLERVAAWAKRLAGGKVAICFDADGAGDDGAKEALWQFAERGLDVRLVWSRAMHGGQFANRQTEEITLEEWNGVLRPSLLRE
jgi:hypothetical protein